MEISERTICYIEFQWKPNLANWTWCDCDADMLDILANDVSYKILDLLDVSTRGRLMLVSKVYREIASAKWREVALTSQRSDEHVLDCLRSIAAQNGQSVISVTVKVNWRHESDDFEVVFSPAGGKCLTESIQSVCLWTLHLRHWLSIMVKSRDEPGRNDSISVQFPHQSHNK